jgi:pantetheine-phosphate adenylyltransferase
MQKRFRTVGVGGTFDELHKGHRWLLSKAFEVGEHVIVGVSSDEFVGKLKKPHATARYKQRLKELRSFLKEKGLLKRARIIRIDDRFGGVLLSHSPIEALVVSRETEPTARSINERRKEMEMPTLEIIVIDMVPSENHSAISTTRIRGGEIDREGHLLKRND